MNALLELLNHKLPKNVRYYLDKETMVGIVNIYINVDELNESAVDTILYYTICRCLFYPVHLYSLFITEDDLYLAVRPIETKMAETPIDAVDNALDDIRSIISTMLHDLIDAIANSKIVVDTDYGIYLINTSTTSYIELGFKKPLCHNYSVIKYRS